MADKKVNLLAIQMGSDIANLQSNISKVESLLKSSLVKYSADFVFLPEVWTVGWECSSFKEHSECLENSKSLKMLSEISREYKTNIIGGSIIEKKSDGTFYNTCPVINRQGKLVCTYEKNHLFSYYGCNEGDIITKGSSPVIVELDGVKLGLSICYDIRFPELYRAYRKAGADILINMAAWGANKKIPWDSMTTSRAVENQTYFVALTQTGELKDGTRNLGHSMIIDYKGDILAEINDIEGGIFASVNLDEMYVFRSKCRVLDDIRDSYEVVLK
jgi:predicted amidohydrolase